MGILLTVMSADASMVEGRRVCVTLRGCDGCGVSGAVWSEVVVGDKYRCWGGSL